MIGDNKQQILKFPDGFLWGASTSAYQVEGGITNDWSQWEMSEKRLRDLRKRGLNYRDFVAGRACDSFHHWPDDIEALKKINCNAYRLGLEWARLEPREGEFSMEAVEYYRQVLSALKQNNIKTAVTIWHWTNPMWLVQEGGWTNKKVVARFARYVEFIAQELGDLVDYWVVLNEPMVLVNNGYLTAKFPPNKRNIFLAWKTMNNLAAAHKRAYEIIHDKIHDAKVGITFFGTNCEPARKWFFGEIFLAKIFNYFCNDLFLRQISGHYDYLGLDYYHHKRIVWHPPFVKNLNEEVNDRGWEIYPKGIYNILKYLQKFKKPIIIMENGIADATDSKRGKFIVDHLKYVHQAIAEGVDVRGYFHWSLLDNFEWEAGWPMKFGLFEVNRETFERKMRPSAKIYAEIAEGNMIWIKD